MLFYKIVLFIVLLNCATIPSILGSERSEEELVEHQGESEQAPRSINDYLRAVLVKFKKHIKNGIPALNIPRLDPFSVKDQRINKRKRSFKVNATLTRNKIRGLLDLRINELDLDLERLRFDMELGLPKIDIYGRYTLEGKIVNIFPVYGNGNYTITVKGLKFSASVAVNITESRAKFTQPPTLDVSFNSLYVRFENLLGGGSLGKFINNIISTLGRPIFDKFRPKLVKSLNDSIFKVINKQLEKIDVGKYVDK